MLKDDIKQHIEDNCANYAGDGQCLLDRRCPFFDGDNESLPRCVYYENAVLPGDDKLKSRYWQSFGLAYWGESSKVCKQCEGVFSPEDKREQYCNECKAVRRQQADKERKRSQRQNSDNY